VVVLFSVGEELSAIGRFFTAPITLFHSQRHSFVSRRPRKIKSVRSHYFGPSQNLVKPLIDLSPVESIRSPCPMSSHQSAIIEITVNKGTHLGVRPEGIANTFII
jgi:hypothetical protein